MGYWNHYRCSIIGHLSKIDGIVEGRLLTVAVRGYTWVGEASMIQVVIKDIYIYSIKDIIVISLLYMYNIDV